MNPIKPRPPLPDFPKTKPSDAARAEYIEKSKEWLDHPSTTLEELKDYMFDLLLIRAAGTKD